MTKPDQDKPKGRLKLPEPLASDLLDFRAANYRAQESEIVQEALREHIDRRLEEPEMKKRFEQARETRLKRTKEPLKLVTQGNDD
jgi:Arc/MetJ-type ribon-helix-helix transcriptional regulator